MKKDFAVAVLCLVKLGVVLGVVLVACSKSPTAPANPFTICNAEPGTVTVYHAYFQGGYVQQGLPLCSIPSGQCVTPAVADGSLLTADGHAQVVHTGDVWEL